MTNEMLFHELLTLINQQTEILKNGQEVPHETLDRMETLRKRLNGEAV